MDAAQFAYWLQGFFELESEGKKKAIPLSAKKVEIIRNHLKLVFQHDLDPQAEAKSGKPAGHLQQIHDGHPPQPGSLLLRC